ncbi:DNA-binding transcriptional dual regulator Crp [Legionella massiliensis]|uniref:DNA-binding transcriptional dual regulator Crp n=1 Tax=Legionella massiliensis TaxID=1034943 RepID=A0A078L0Y7_9GAMM|nr:cyclic nucleotide-binding domain-containing protein [Legionella massiliensis]CDZ77718.1 DNA-binding transcriptional dual regulator Crp [Legionella massiliensis]CEE13456.1 DNA-binding transcriptional dual regulator Crp [Legionella massiliensis]
MEIKPAIKYEEVPFFNGLTSKEIKFILPYMEEKKFAKGEIILPQGSRGGDLYLVISGFVSVDINLPGDYQKRLAVLGANEVFGEVTFLSNTLVTATVAALEPCCCIVFYHKLLEMLRTAKPDVSYKIEKEIAHQTADKIILNINNILKILDSIPRDESDYEHRVSLENPYAYIKELDINKLDLNHIQKLSFFNRLTENQILKLLSLMKAKGYGKGYRFLSNNKELNKIGIVYSGAVMFFIKENNELKKSIAISGVGDLFLQNFIFPAFRQVADYVTCEKCVILELDMGVYLELYQANPAIFYTISESINRAIISSVYSVNRQFLRINSEFNNIIP